jgi:5-enolpyruvylshikimate-3-phosphate synthase
MAFAPLALKVPIIIDANVVSKSYPDFLGGYENFRV